MSFETIIGQPLAVQLVQRWLVKDTNQPLIFYGQDVVGQKALALEAAKALNCQKTPGVKGCETCLSCTKIEAGRHPDVRVIDMLYQATVRGEPVEKQQSLKIETVLEERRRLYQTSGEGTWKVSIIDGAEKLTQDAANVLLKVLEEPPPKTAIFLLTPHRDRLFATILSRCQPVRFRLLSDQEKHHTLTHDEIQDAAEAETLWARIPQMTPGQILAKTDHTRLPAGRQGRGATVTRADIEDQINRLLSPALREFRSSGARAAGQKLAWIQKAQQQLRQNVPPALVYDHLLLKLSKQPHS